jgi:hypothetical protein
MIHNGRFRFRLIPNRQQLSDIIGCEVSIGDGWLPLLYDAVSSIMDLGPGIIIHNVVRSPICGMIIVLYVESDMDWALVDPLYRIKMDAAEMSLRTCECCGAFKERVGGNMECDRCHDRIGISGQ